MFGLVLLQLTKQMWMMYCDPSLFNLNENTLNNAYIHDTKEYIARQFWFKFLSVPDYLSRPKVPYTLYHVTAKSVFRSQENNSILRKKTL